MKKKIASYVIFGISTLIFLLVSFYLVYTYLDLYISVKKGTIDSGEFAAAVIFFALIGIIISYGGYGISTVLNIIATVIYRKNDKFKWDPYMIVIVCMDVIPFICALVFTLSLSLLQK